MTKSTHEVFEIQRRLDDRENNLAAVELVPGTDYRAGMAFFPDETSWPERIVLTCNNRALPHTDFPSGSLPMVSRRLIETILELGPLPITVISVELHDRADESINHDFVFPYFRKHADLLDMEAAEYELWNEDGEELLDIEELVLATPPDGFPAMFRLRHDGMPFRQRFWQGGPRSGRHLRN